MTQVVHFQHPLRHVRSPFGCNPTSHGIEQIRGMTMRFQGIDANQNFISYLGPIFCVLSDAQGHFSSGRKGEQ